MQCTADTRLFLKRATAASARTAGSVRNIIRRRKSEDKEAIWQAERPSICRLSDMNITIAEILPMVAEMTSSAGGDATEKILRYS
jgi:hypothetical protein